jgi:hypothetical protein
MSASTQILPGTGRGTMRSMVEGARRPLRPILPAPSTTPLRDAVRSRVDRSPGAILGYRGQPNPTSPVPGRNEVACHG